MKNTDQGAVDPRWPPVKRRMGTNGTTECLCSKCGKWIGFGIILGLAPPYRYECPECAE